MIRFQPDSWLEGLLRPLLLADPAAGLYYEDAAPDWRFAALLAGLGVVTLSGRLRQLAGFEQRRTLVLLFVLLYAWTFSIGNGRYFISGLMLVGPLLVMTLMWLPGTRSLRWTLVLLLLAVQAATVWVMYRAGAWGLTFWEKGPAVSVSDSPVRDKPAVFVTVTAISYSALVPLFHPESRWASLAGQVEITPRRPEYGLLRELLMSPLPKYFLSPVTQSDGDEPAAQPDEVMWSIIRTALHEHGLEPDGLRCELLRTNLLRHRPPPESGKPPTIGALWACPVRTMAQPLPLPGTPVSPDPYDDVFARLEAYCPRFFAPGSTETKVYADHRLRYYLSSDMRVFVENGGEVRVKYFRALSPTIVGTVESVRAGHIRLDCSRIPGRYVPPWSDRR